MKNNEWFAKKWITKTIAVVLLVALAVLSVTVLADIATDPATYAATVESIDEKKATVMGVTATAVTASTALAAVPGDVTTPIANQILEISEYLFLVVCIFVLEKSMLTVMGYFAFNILLPVACALMVLYILAGREGLKVLALKIAVFALVIATIIPLSMKISNFIYEMNSVEIEQVTQELNEVTIDTADEEEIVTEEATQPQEAVEEEKGFLGNLKDIFSNKSNEAASEEQDSGNVFDKLKDKLTGTADEIKEQAKKILNQFIDAIALFVIIYCAVPIAVVLIMVWFVNTLFGLDLRIPDKKKLSFRGKKEKEESCVET